MLNFLEFLRRKYAEYNNNPIRRGTVVDELAIKPTGMALQDFYNILVENQLISNINNWPRMTEEQLDAFGGKFFYPRITGSKAFGVVRIWVDTPSDLMITTNFRAVSKDGLNYVASNPGPVSKNSMLKADDEFGGYYFDVHIIAELPGITYNKAAGEINSLSGVDFEYSHVTNLEDLVPGTPHESNEEYAARLMYALNDRSMMTKRSMYAGLKNLFPFIQSVYIAGAGDKYMVRDLLYATNISEALKRKNFLGKLPGDSNVKHTAYYGLFPPEPGTRGAVFGGPFSIYSRYQFWPTIEAIDLLNPDPAYHGYPLYQEATSEMYQGLYFDDFRSSMTIATRPLFDIQEEFTSVNSIVPNSDWIVGANACKNGDYGITPELSGTIGKTDLVKFIGTDIIIGAGIGVPITAGKNIAKRLGVKITGSFTIPENLTETGALGSSFQIIVGGKNRIDAEGFPIINSYSGIGFGIVMFKSFSDINEENPYNASVFFSNSQGYYDTLVYSSDSEAYSGIHALAEKPARIEEGRRYDFEFVVYDAGYDNLGTASNPSAPSLSIKITPSDPGIPDIFGTAGSVWTIPNSKLQPFIAQLVNPNSDAYGLMMKITVDAPQATKDAKWRFSDLLAMDIAPHRATALFMFNVDDLEEPIELSLRASGSGVLNNRQQPGYSAYIWNIEIPGAISGTTLMNSGSWELLDGLSNPDGSKDVILSTLTQKLTNLDRYVISSRYGKIIALLLAATGESKTGIRANNDVLENIPSTLTVYYVQLKSLLEEQYHGNHKADIYVNTLRNTDSPMTITKDIELSANMSYFVLNRSTGFVMPVFQIISITDPDTGQILSENDYYTFRESRDKFNSVLDSINLVAEGHTKLRITYTTYNNIGMIQDFFDGVYGKIYGDILVRHKYPIYLDCGLFYTGNTNPDELASVIRSYVDSNCLKIFDVRKLIQFLYQNSYVNNIKEPLTFFYSRINDEFVPESGSFDNIIVARDIEFFRIRNLNINLL